MSSNKRKPSQQSQNRDKKRNKGKGKGNQLSETEESSEPEAQQSRTDNHADTEMSSQTEEQSNTSMSLDPLENQSNFDMDSEETKDEQLALFKGSDAVDATSARRQENETAPLFSRPVYKAAVQHFGPEILPNSRLIARKSAAEDDEDPRIFLNTGAP